MMRPKLRRLLRWSRYALVSAATAIAVLAVMDGLKSRGMPPLEPWHTVELKSEFDRHAGIEDFAAYLDLEQRLFAELERAVIDRYQPSYPSELNRYVPDSISSPRRFERDYNRSFELVPAAPRGAAVLLHGLTDSPYSLRQLAEDLYAQDFYVLAMRLPGHGTVPGALTRMVWEDWAAAAAIAIRHAAARVAPEQPLYVAGYSMGGALALNHVADDLLDDGESRVDRLLLFSPAVGVSAFAWAANLERLVSPFAYFKKARWASVVPEFDPFKYQSFPKNAAWQVRRITRQLDRKVARLFEAGRTADFPSVFTAMSVVDATVSVQSVVELLYRRLREPRHELLLVDINHHHRAEGYMEPGIERRLDELFAAGRIAYQRRILSNYYTGSPQVEEVVSRPGAVPSRQPLGLAWPEQLFSLSHVALTFTPEDPVYGSEFHPENISLGALALRGEIGILQIRDNQIMRLRYNPFYSYLDGRIKALVRADTMPVTGSGRLGF
jgi:alpha-beta hydrolase superfamily lysophospholipase